mgnify:FL=1
MNLAAVLIGIPSLLFGLLIAYGLIRRFNGNLNDAPPKNRWILGVCEDFSRMVGLFFFIFSVFFVIYTPLVIGPILYTLYYIVMRVRTTAPPIDEDTSNLQVTKIESHYYRN